MASSVLVRSLERTVCIDTPERCVLVGELKAYIQNVENIPAGLQRLTLEGKELRDNDRLEVCDIAPIVLNLRLPGGKGGFGSLMRAYAAKLAARAKKGEQDVGAMRDLNGRRIRHVQTEQKISEWQAQEHKIDHRQLQKTFQEIGQGKKPTAEKGKCKYGVNCKYKWKCRYTHPDDEERARRCRPVTSISTSFGEEGGTVYEGDSRQNIISAVQQGLKRAKKRGRPEEEKGDSLEDVEDAGEENKGEDTNKRARVGDSKLEEPKEVSEKGPAEKKNSGEIVEKPKAKKYGPVDLSKFKAASELEKLGLDHLKAELQRVGLKCGGNLTQRAERLFLLKTKKIDELPKKLKAKPKMKK
uniref:Ubiquitin-like domain-containing protein n=1 Tax=Lotharella oceanica TaxID=641309 RepID=A0A7S2X6D8_9EUKA|mmetsp:Transcript_12228/g.23532  ORF Transcript_12228/g.23532 Transcript_12228/m.23532 type:complete len:356 (+) Transcript_12228:3-1070(+)